MIPAHICGLRQVWNSGFAAGYAATEPLRPQVPGRCGTPAPDILRECSSL